MMDIDKFINILESGNEPSVEELGELELFFRNMEIKDKELTLKGLDGFFKKIGKAGIKSFWKSYFRWYVWLSWTFLNSQDIDFVERAVAKQVPMAILQEFDVLRKIMWYLSSWAKDKEEMASFYNRIKNAFLNSDATVGLYKGTEVFLRDLVADIRNMNSREENSIVSAEFMSRLKQIMFPQDDAFYQNYIFINKDTATERLHDTVDLFLRLSPDKVSLAVDHFISPEINLKTKEDLIREVGNLQIFKREFEGSKLVYKTEAAPSAKSAPIPTLSQTVKQKDEVKKVENKNVNSKPTAPPPAKPADFRKPTYEEIKRAVEHKYEMNSDGQFVNLEEVLAKLSELAEKYNDSKIAEIYYFDEADGKFKWNS